MLLPEARGKAKVQSARGAIEIEAAFDNIEPATKFGPEYLTYVLWAISPEGRASNLGELRLKGMTGAVQVTTPLQTFGLIVTAEPYFAVTQPSDVVVLENVVRKDTIGNVEPIDAKYELLQRGQYTLNVNPADIQPMKKDKKIPLDIFQARNAIQIAKGTGADQFASEPFKKAERSLHQAEDYLTRKKGKKLIVTAARDYLVQQGIPTTIIVVRGLGKTQPAASNDTPEGRRRNRRVELIVSGEVIGTKIGSAPSSQ